MTLQQLQYFVTVCKYQNLTKAAVNFLFLSREYLHQSVNWKQNAVSLCLNAVPTVLH